MRRPAIQARIAGTDAGSRWARALWPLAGLEAIAGIVLAVLSTRGAQAYDAIGYPREGLALTRGDASWLQAGPESFHNYLYPAFLGLLHDLGLWSSIQPSGHERLLVALVQIALLYTAAAFSIVVLSRTLRIRAAGVAVLVNGIALLVASAFSGYWLSEALAGPVLMVFLALWVWTSYRIAADPGSRSARFGAFAVGFAAACTWMIRPAFVWIPVAAIALVAAMVVGSAVAGGAAGTGRGPRRTLVHLTTLVGLVLVGCVLPTLPQLALDPQVADLFRLSLAGQQDQASATIWRYATNLSGCGAVSMPFSPLASDLAPLVNGVVVRPNSLLFDFTGAVAHFVSGWDPLPSPNYATMVAAKPWILVTFVSGFVLAAPLAAGKRLALELGALIASRRGGGSDERPGDGSGFATERVAAFGALAGVLALFAATEVTLLRTATEFRYNLLGWLAAAVAGVFLFVHGRPTRKQVLTYLIAGAVLSLFILTVGQMTLDYSTYWRECTQLAPTPKP